MTGGRPWTPDEDARLREMAEAGIPYEKIGEVLGRTQQAIQNRCYTTKIRFRGEPKPKPKPDRAVGPVESFFLNGEPLQFAVTDDPCARCAVKESVHHLHGCGQFATSIRVRIR